MITDEQIFTACEVFYKNERVLGHNLDVAMRKALEAYEQSKWVKFDVDDESTWPQRTGHHIIFDGCYVAYKRWDRAIGGDKRCVNQSWFVSESVNFKKATHWQYLPTFKE